MANRQIEDKGFSQAMLIKENDVTFSHSARKILTIFVLVVASLLASTVYAQSDSRKSGYYLIGPEDLLEISVWREESLRREVLVRPDGRISFPLVGEIIAKGKTPDNLKNEITLKLKKFIAEPVVTVLIKKVSSYKIYVIGQVKKPGEYLAGRFLDVIQALALAGGLTPFAVEDRIAVIRRKNGKEEVIPFNYTAIKEHKNFNQNIILESGDVLLVP